MSKGTVLIKQGDDKELAQKFYVVESGKFSVSVNGEIVGNVGQGEEVENSLFFTTSLRRPPLLQLKTPTFGR